METQYNQPTSSPTAKVAAGGIAGSITVVLLYLVRAIFNVDVPGEVAAAMTAIISFAASYLVKETVPTVGQIADSVKKDLSKSK